MDLTIRACDDLACSEELHPKHISVFVRHLEYASKHKPNLTNAMTMVISSACNEALLIRRATKRSTTAIQARDRHIAYDAMISGDRS